MRFRTKTQGRIYSNGPNLPASFDRTSLEAHAWCLPRLQKDAWPRGDRPRPSGRRSPRACFRGQPVDHGSQGGCLSGAGVDGGFVWGELAFGARPGTRDQTFWGSPHIIRYAVGENGYGFSEVNAARVAAESQP